MGGYEVYSISYPSWTQLFNSAPMGLPQGWSTSPCAGCVVYFFCIRRVGIIQVQQSFQHLWLCTQSDLRDLRTQVGHQRRLGV